jgi:hypothetical protein
MPFRLSRPLGGAPGSSTPRAPSMSMPDHPVLPRVRGSDLPRGVPGDPGLALAWHHRRLAAPEPRVPARLTDAEQSPLLVARTFGEGKIVFLTSVPGSEYRADRWNRLDDPMVAFPLLHGLVKWLALPAVDPFQVQVGAELSCSLPARPENVEVQRPERDGRQARPVAEDPRRCRAAATPAAGQRHGVRRLLRLRPRARPPAPARSRCRCRSQSTSTSTKATFATQRTTRCARRSASNACSPTCPWRRRRGRLRRAATSARPCCC